MSSRARHPRCASASTASGSRSGDSSSKQPLIDLMCVAAVAQEPLLLVGPPGTAKSDLVIKFKDALRIPDGEYFEYLLTRFTEPNELFGPVDIPAFRQGTYRRRTEV